MDITAKLNSLNLTLPEVSTPGGNYTSVNLRGNIAYVAIQFPIRNGDFLFQGRLGDELTTQDGYEAMQLCALNVLAQIGAKVGWEQVVGLNHADMYYRAVPEWDDAPAVANGASDLFVQVLEDRGRHTRSLTGVDHLPRYFSVGLTTSWTVRS